MKKHKPVQYRYGLASEEGKAMYAFGNNASNPMREVSRIIPIHNLKVGEALFFHLNEMPLADVNTARTLARRYSNQYDGFLEFIKHYDSNRKYCMLEIVRIK